MTPLVSYAALPDGPDKPPAPRGNQSVAISPAGPQSESEMTLKCIVIGDQSVGKSTMLDALVNGNFDPSITPTIGIDFKVIRGVVSEAPKTTDYKLQIWDCAGQIRFRSIVSSYFRLAQVVIVVFDLTTRDSFCHVRDWYGSVEKELPAKEFLHFLVCNKSDDTRNRVVSDSEIDEVAREFGFHKTFYMSARQRVGLESTFQTIVLDCHNAIESGKLKPLSKTPSAVYLTQTTNRSPNMLSSCLHCVV